MKLLVLFIVVFAIVLSGCGTTASLEKKNMKLEYVVVTDSLTNQTDTLVTYKADEYLMMKDIVKNTSTTASNTGFMIAFTVIVTVIALVVAAGK